MSYNKRNPLISSRNIKQIDNQFFFKVTFDYTKENNGYILGVPRNYSKDKVHKLINSTETKTWIDKGNAVIMYGHGARDYHKGSYVPREHNPTTGEVQIPIGKITKLSVNPKSNSKIDFEGVLFISKNNKTEDVIEMIKVGIGGFSFVWNLKDGIFYGADYVLVQNFSSNRVLLDSLSSICENGECSISNNTILDSIVPENIPLNLYKKANDLWQNQEEFKYIEKINNKIIELENKLSDKSEYSKDIAIENKKLREENRDIKRKLKNIEKSIRENGLSLIDDSVEITGLNKIFEAVAYTNEFDEVVEKVKKQRDSKTVFRIKR